MEDDYWAACLHGASGFLGFATTPVCIYVLLAGQGDAFKRLFPHSIAEAQGKLCCLLFYKEINNPHNFPATLHFGV